MDNEALVRGNVPPLLETVDGKCGRLRQPGMRSLGGGWAGATQETREYGGGTGKGMVQEGGEGESKG